MKKTLVFFALAFISIANAQKGTILVAGSIGISSQKETNATFETKGTFITISPKVGYQFNDKWTVGVESSVSNNKKKQNYSHIENTDTAIKEKKFSGGGFIRYTKPLSEIFSIYADLGVGFQNIKTTSDYFYGNGETTTYSSKGTGFYTNVTPALAINFTKGFGLNFNIGGLGYETMHYDNNQNDISNFNLNFGQSFNIGISKNF